MNLTDKALFYFQAFARKDLLQIKDMLHPDVALRDWAVDLSGRDAVVAEMAKAFGAFTNIGVIPTRVYQDNNTVIGELDITLDHEVIKVVDIIEFSIDQRIHAIRAFKG